MMSADNNYRTRALKSRDRRFAKIFKKIEERDRARAERSGTAHRSTLVEAQRTTERAEPSRATRTGRVAAMTSDSAIVQEPSAPSARDEYARLTGRSAPRRWSDEQVAEELEKLRPISQKSSDQPGD